MAGYYSDDDDDDGYYGGGDYDSDRYSDHYSCHSDDDEEQNYHDRSRSPSPYRHGADEHSARRSPSSCESPSRGSSGHYDSEDDESDARENHGHHYRGVGEHSPSPERRSYSDESSKDRGRHEEPPYATQHKRGRGGVNGDSDGGRASGTRFSERKPFGDYTVKSRGVGEKGNRWDARNYPKYPDEKPYHYSNKDGGYYYDNPDGSRYYNDGRGSGRYQPPGRDKWYKCRKG